MSKVFKDKAVVKVRVTDESLVANIKGETVVEAYVLSSDNEPLTLLIEFSNGITLHLEDILTVTMEKHKWH